jgi:hypothetical protein
MPVTFSKGLFQIFSFPKIKYMTNTFQFLQGVKLLSKDAQKKLSGGLALAGGSCAAEVKGGGSIGTYNVSKADAQAYAAANGTHWCCDSCMSAGWFVDYD